MNLRGKWGEKILVRANALFCNKVFLWVLNSGYGVSTEGGKPVVKPGSVVDNHSSRRTVASTLKQPTRKQREPRHVLPYLALLQMGFAVPSVLPRPR